MVSDKATQTDPIKNNDKAVQVKEINDEGELLRGSFKRFGSEQIEKADARQSLASIRDAMVEAYTVKPVKGIPRGSKDDGDDDDGDEDKAKDKLNLMRIIVSMLRQGAEITDIILYVSYYASLTTLQVMELTAYVTVETLTSSFDLAGAIVSWLSNNNIETPPVSVHSSPAISVSSASPPISVHSSHQTSEASDLDYDIAPPTEIPEPTDVESEEEEQEQEQEEASSSRDKTAKD